MPVKTAIGKGSKISTPAAGTLKRASPAISGLISTRSKLANSKSESTNRTESSLPTEIVALIDFNRVYGESFHLTQYGEYFEALSSIHSITTEDVKYVVDKSIENDPAGLWASLKEGTDKSVADAEDFIEDLANLLDKVEQAEISLDINRSNDSDLQAAAVEYLQPKLKKYEQPAENRSFQTRDFYALGSTWAGEQSLQSLLTDIRYSITREDHPEYKTQIIDALSHKKSNDLNEGTHWSTLGRVSANPSDRLIAFATSLSQVMSLSVGIERLRSDSISSRIAFDPNNLSAIFEGTKRGDSIPFAGKLSSKMGPGVVSLSLLQFNSRNGKTVVPVALRDPSNEKFTSGPTTMVRDALQQGDYEFSDFSDYCAQFENSRVDIERYTELLVGQCDTSNVLTPIEIMRTVIKHFIKALELAESDDRAQYELMVFKKSNSGSGTLTAVLKQFILRSATRTKTVQLESGTSSSANGDESKYKISLSTSKTSKGEALKEDAEVTTTQVEDKSPKTLTRIIERLASASPTSDEMAEGAYNTLSNVAADGPPTKQEINASIKELKEALKRYDERLIAGYVLIATGIYAIAGAIEVASALGKIEQTKARIETLTSVLANSPKYDKKDTVTKYLRDMTLTPDGTVVSSLVNAYNEILNFAVSKLPEGRTMTLGDGTTRFGNFDELSLMSLLVEMFVLMSSSINASISKDSLGNMLLIGMDAPTFRSMKIDLLSLVPDSDEFLVDSITCDDAPDVKTATSKLYDDIKKYQNRQAFLSAYSTVLKKSKDDLVAGVKDLLGSPGRRNRLDNALGRKLMSTISSQQVIYRRYLLDKYRPAQEAGYLPACVVYSDNDNIALKRLIMSARFSSRKSENIRIAFAAVPINTISDSIPYVNELLGDVNYSGFLELSVRKKDEELDDLIFKDLTYLFDQGLYVVPGSLLSLKTTKRQPSVDAALELAKQCRYRLYSKSGYEDLDYQQLRNHSRYSKLNSQKKDEIAKNAITSYLLELYTFKVTGSVFDESVSLELDDSVSAAGQSALVSIARLQLNDLKLPNESQINGLFSNGELDFSFDDGILTSGDKELISSLTDSYIMKSETPIDRLTATPAFDRIFAVAFDPDDFVIDESQTVKSYGSVGRAMINSLQQASLLVKENGDTRIIPRDPQSGGFSIASFTCQFAPHTLNSNGDSILKLLNSKKEKKPSVSSDKLSAQSKLNNIQASTKSFTFSKTKR